MHPPELCSYCRVSYEEAFQQVGDQIIEAFAAGASLGDIRAAVLTSGFTWDYPTFLECFRRAIIRLRS